MKKKTKILIFLGIVTLGIGYYGYEMLDFVKGVQNDIETNKKNNFKIDSLKIEIISNGKWISLNDSLSIVRIKDGFEWIFEYNESKIDSSDCYSYGITKKDNIRLLTLTNKNDTLEYALDYLTDENMSMIYLPRGNYLNYKRIE